MKNKKKPKKESNKERGGEERKGIKNSTSMIFWEKVGLCKGPHSELEKPFDYCFEGTKDRENIKQKYFSKNLVQFSGDIESDWLSLIKRLIGLAN